MYSCYVVRLRLICFLFPVWSSPGTSGLQYHLRHKHISRYAWAHFWALYTANSTDFYLLLLYI